MYNTKLQEVIVCPCCGGPGKIKVGNLREMHNHDIVICPFCRGDNLCIRITTVEYFRKTDLLMELLIK